MTSQPTQYQEWQARAYWASVGRPWPSLVSVILLTLVLGVFGVFIAYNESQKAQRWGVDTFDYYAAWLITWLVESVGIVGLWLFLVHQYVSDSGLVYP